MAGNSITTLLYRSRGRPEAPAILAPGQAPLSYTGLLKQAEATGARLRDLGIDRRDRVAVVLPNGPEMASAFVSIAAAAACAPLNPAYREQDFEFFLQSLRAKALVVGGDGPSAATQAAQRIGVRVLRLRKERNAAAGVFRLEGDRAPASKDQIWAEPDDVALLLHTSGTTTKPKLVPLLGRNLCASASNISDTLRLGPEDRCLNIMPLFHVHGLVASVLATLAAGASVVCTNGTYEAGFFAGLREYEPTWYTAVPTMHLALLERVRTRPEIIETARLRFIRSSSSSLARPLLVQLEQAFGTPVIDAYGMTEAAHQVTCNPLPPVERKLGSVGRAAGSEVAIMDDAGRLLAAGATGEVVIRGANVMRGYEHDQAANRGAFVDGWLRTGDQGWMDTDGYLHLTGRLKELINRGGEKFAPGDVDVVLLGHPAVRQALTFAIPHPRLGEDVGAAVELTHPGTADEAALRRHAAERLPIFKRPRTIWIVDEIPKGPTGKPQRRELMEMLGIDGHDTEAAVADYIEPRTELEQRIAAIWCAMLRIPRVGVKDDFSRLGGDSLQAIEMLAAVSNAEGVDLPFLQFLDEGTVESLASEIEAWTSGRQGCEGLVALQPGGERAPLFCVPGHDGVLAGISRLARVLGASQPVWAFTLEGLEDAAGVEETAARCLALLRERQVRGPYRLVGVCFGVLVVYEMARQLESEKEDVELVR